MSASVRRSIAWSTTPTLSCPSLAQLAVEPERLVRRRRVLHVDADEVAARRGVLDDGAEVVAAEVVAELQSERGELDADVRVEAAALDVGEHVLVGADDRGASSSFLISSPRTSIVASFPSPLSAPDRLARVLQLGPGDVALGELLHDRPRHGRKQADDRAVEDAPRAGEF